jgi:quercetin dioxygenase-like cupin family protein
VDYIIVLKGEIHAIMDSGEVKLKAGDVLVQRGTNHSWSVRGRKPCIIAAVLVSAKPAAAAGRAGAKKAVRKRAKAPAKRR